jgi:hypothetical protein
MLASVAVPPAAGAEEAETEAWRDDARRLATQAAESFEDKDNENAQDLFERARKL